MPTHSNILMRVGLPECCRHCWAQKPPKTAKGQDIFQILKFGALAPTTFPIEIISTGNYVVSVNHKSPSATEVKKISTDKALRDPSYS